MRRRGVWRQRAQGLVGRPLASGAAGAEGPYEHAPQRPREGGDVGADRVHAHQAEGLVAELDPLKVVLAPLARLEAGVGLDNVPRGGKHEGDDDLRGGGGAARGGGLDEDAAAGRVGDGDALRPGRRGGDQAQVVRRVDDLAWDRVPVSHDHVHGLGCLAQVVH